MSDQVSSVFYAVNSNNEKKDNDAEDSSSTKLPLCNLDSKKDVRTKNNIEQYNIAVRKEFLGRT
jgi:hypothetical protein